MCVWAHTCVCVSSFGCVQLCNPMDCSPADSSVHGILEARILEWVPMSSSRVSSWPRDRICISYVSCIGRWVLSTSATWKAHDVLCIKGKYAGWQYTALSYSFPNYEPGHCSMSGSDCCFLIHIQVFRRQVRRSGTPISLRIFQFVVIHTVKGFSILNEADVFLELPCFLHSSVYMLTSLNFNLDGFSWFVSVGLWEPERKQVEAAGLCIVEHLCESGPFDSFVTMIFFPAPFLWWYQSTYICGNDSLKMWALATSHF